MVCTPKCKGGLGIKNLEEFNITLLSKWRWRFLVENDDAMWKKVLTHRYGLTIPWANIEELNRRLKGSSIWWRDLIGLGADSVLGKYWFNEVAKKNLGGGDSIQFWTDSWLGRNDLKSIFPALYETCELKRATVADMGEWHNDSWT